jgi:two-component system, cell cycle sensor histidine kinase and response regulator CckA
MHENGRATILLVDDDPLVRRVVAQVLLRFGYDVIEADCGPTGLECFLRHRKRVDLVVSDVLMPRMSGPEMIREIHRVDPSARVVFMTGYLADERTREIIRQGAPESAPILAKPFTHERLLATVAQCLAA